MKHVLVFNPPLLNVSNAADEDKLFCTIFSKFNDFKREKKRNKREKMM